MKLLQFTDIHLTTQGETIGGRDPNANFERALAHALSQHPDAEALIITGDLSDWGDRKDYVRLRDRIESLPIPVHLCIGNHDERSVFAEVFPERLDANGFVQTVVHFSYGKGVLIDTWAPETHAGFFCETRAAWLDSVLSEMNAPAWLFLHHNPAPTHIEPMDQIMLLNADRFGGVVERHRAKIAHIFHGHCHLPLSGSFRGVPVSAPRGTNHAGWANFGEKNLLSGSYLPEAYSVIFASENAVTIHMIEYGYDGEVMIEASPDYACWNRSVMVR